MTKLERPQPIYAKSTAGAECFLAQGEIISELIHVHVDLKSLENPALGCDLRLMSSVKDIDSIPTEGKSLIIVAAIDHVLHFRTFDADGKMVVDTDETRSVEQARQIGVLRKQLESLWPPHELTMGEKGRVITAVTSIAGQAPPLRVAPKLHPFALILTQGCELEQDFHARRGEVLEDKQIPAILFCEVVNAVDLRSRVKKSEHWNLLKSNRDERYHFFQAVEKEFDVEGEGLPELGVDLKRIFTIPTDEVYYRIRCGEARRRCCLQSPYLEHSCHRFANFLSRVALPEPHSSI
jgi:hypothetical protein